MEYRWQEASGEESGLREDTGGETKDEAKEVAEFAGGDNGLSSSSCNFCVKIVRKWL